MRPLANGNLNGDVNLSINAGRLLDKALNESGSARSVARAAIDDSVYSITVSVDGSGATRTQNATGTRAELDSKTFAFDNIAVGATIIVSCEISCDGAVFWEGESEPTTIVAGQNNINVTMRRAG